MPEKSGVWAYNPNEVHPETGGFSFGSKTAIWNNQGDTGHLSDTAGTPVSSKTYAPEKK